MQKAMLCLRLLLIVLLASASALAQQKDLIFEHYTVDRGLSQSTVNCIMQGSKGFMWFGTQDGLNRFDGYSFHFYQHNPLDTNSVSSNWIYSFDEDKFGRIWMGSQIGVNMLDPKTDRIYRFIHDPKNPSSLGETEAFGVLVDRYGSVWVKTATTLNKLDTVTGKFLRFQHEDDYFRSNRSDRGFPMLEDEEGIWCGSSIGLHFFNRKFEQFKTYNYEPTDPNSISDDFITGLALDPKGNLWVATRNGLNCLNKKTGKFTRYYSNPGDPSGLPVNSLNNLFFGHDGFLWITSEGGGILKFNTKTGKVLRYSTEANNTSSLIYDFTITVFEDKSMNLWIGTDGAGLDKCDLKRKNFGLFTNTGGSSAGFSSIVIGSLFVDDEDRIWVGTWDAGLDILDRKTQIITNYNTQGPPGKKLVGNNIHVIMRDSRGLVWIGTKTGISIYDKGEFFDLRDYFKFEGFPNFQNNRIYAMLEDRRGNVWVGTKNGLHRFNMSDMSVTPYRASYTDTLSLFDNNIVCLMEDSEGYIWVGTQSGLNKYDYNTNKFFRIGHLQKKAPGKNKYYNLSNRYIYELLEDSIDGSIWIGTGTGLNRYNKKDGSFEYFTEKHGLPNETIYEIEQDSKGNLWMTTNRGIAVLDRKTMKIRAYDRADGLQGLEFNNGASYKSAKGEILFGGTSGFNAFYPDSMQDNNFIPAVVFTTFEMNTGNDKVTINLNGVQELVLSYADHSLTFNFAALEFTKPEKNSYMYMMEGLNNVWVPIGHRSFQDFGSLPPGEYVLHIKGSNNDYIWNEKGASLRIIVKPPVWRTSWAIGIYILIFSAAIYYIFKMRTRKLRIANTALRAKQMAALEIAKQKEELSVKNKSITDSINYAKRIQEAMLPSEFLFRKLIPQSFIFYKPKDIVSGDFYWITEKENKIFIAAVDCTGHGVPGAFMSIIGYDLLRNITRERGVETPSQILNLLNMGISETFSRHSSETMVKDGMDVSLLVIDRNNRQIEYSGAMNPLYIARSNKLIEVKGNRFSVGKMEGHEDLRFDNHVVQFRPNDMVYIFSDGYADQFGGPLGKKFKFRRFKHLLLTIHSLPLHKQKVFLEENFESWRGQLEQVDDILLIGIRM